MPSIKYTKWKGTQRLDQPNTQELSKEQAQKYINELLKKGYRYRFGKQYHDIATLSKLVNNVEHIFTISFL